MPSQLSTVTTLTLHQAALNIGSIIGASLITYQCEAAGLLPVVAIWLKVPD